MHNVIVGSILSVLGHQSLLWLDMKLTSCLSWLYKSCTHCTHVVGIRDHGVADGVVELARRTEAGLAALRPTFCDILEGYQGRSLTRPSLHNANMLVWLSKTVGKPPNQKKPQKTFNYRKKINEMHQKKKKNKPKTKLNTFDPNYRDQLCPNNVFC